MTSIDQLPVEILMNIFRFLPIYGQVSLVNKLFYNVACSVNDSNICVKFVYNLIVLEDPNHQSIIDSIQNTQRKISKVFINFNGVRRSGPIWELAISDTMKILRKFSATIKFFRLDSVSLEIPDFLEMLSLTLNAEHLYFYNLSGATHSPTKKRLNKECFKLQDQLKTLELVECSEEFLVVFSRLPAGVLREFNVAYWNLDFDLLTDFFKQQSNIKKLTFSDEDEHGRSKLPDNIFDHLKLKSFECYLNEYDSRHANILSKQTQLTSLRLRGDNAEVDKSVLNAITNQLSELDTLEVNVNEALDVPVKEIVKLKKLKDLTLHSCTLKIIETFSGLDNSRITSLNMKDINLWNDDQDMPMPINIIGALRNSLPNLKVLRFDHFGECPSIVAIMEHFNFVEVLEMKFDGDIDANRMSETIKVDRCLNEKLTELIITENFLYEESILTKLIAIYPNLKKLVGSSSKPLTPSQLKLILNGLKKINSLWCYFGWRWNLTEEFLDCIKDHKSNLKSIRLSVLEELTTEQKKKLGAMFDIIRHKLGTLYMANEKIVNSV